MRVLYLVFNEGYSGDVDLAAEAIRLTRQLAAAIDHEEVAGLLALMLLHHARRPSRTAPDGALVPLAEQDRTLWDTRLIAEGVDVLQTALARDRLGEFQAQAAIAALHADAPTAEETDWVQIVEWYDELVRLTDSPVVRLNRAVAVGEADGPRAGLAALVRARPRPAPPHRRRGVPARARRRPRHRGPALRRGGPVGAQPPRTRPPHPPGRPPQRTPARLSIPHGRAGVMARRAGPETGGLSRGLPPESPGFAHLAPGQWVRTLKVRWLTPFLTISTVWVPVPLRNRWAQTSFSPAC